MTSSIPRGVYSTPPPLVEWVVRSVHLVLRDRFALAGGLADPKVRLLDPAAGPLNFILAAWTQALSHHTSCGGDAATLLNEHLLPHSRGIEALADTCRVGRAALHAFLAPYEHLHSRPRVLVCGDALAGPAAGALVSGGLPVILGNPPWIGLTPHRGSWITRLLRGYQLPDGRVDPGCYQVDEMPLGDRNKRWILDDCIKFLRLAQWIVDREGAGIVAFVINHNALDAPTLRGFRASLFRAFDEVWALDLHGNRRKAGDITGDQNLFPGVRQGCGVLLLVKRPGLERKIFRADLRGSRAFKLQALDGDLSNLSWTELRPRSPLYLLAASAEMRVEREYLQGVPLDQIFPQHTSGLITGRDSLFTAIDRRTLELRLQREDRLDWLSGLTLFLARPFDLRYIVYLPALLARPRRSMMSHLRKPNLALVVPRLQKDPGAALVTAWLTGHKAVTHYDTSSIFPLYIYSEDQPLPNVSAHLPEALGEIYGNEVLPEELLSYIYAVLQAPLYQNRYRSLLAQGFPRIPFPRSARTFEHLVKKGRELILLHLFRDERLTSASLPLVGDPSLILEECTYSAEVGTLVLNCQGLRFSEVTPEVWGYRVGGYSVVPRWLQARRGRALGARELLEAGSLLATLHLTLLVREDLVALVRSAVEDSVSFSFHQNWRSNGSRNES